MSAPVPNRTIAGSSVAWGVWRVEAGNTTGRDGEIKSREVRRLSVVVFQEVMTAFARCGNSAHLAAIPVSPRFHALDATARWHGAMCAEFPQEPALAAIGISDEGRLKLHTVLDTLNTCREQSCHGEIGVQDPSHQPGIQCGCPWCLPQSRKPAVRLSLLHTILVGANVPATNRL